MATLTVAIECEPLDASSETFAVAVRGRPPWSISASRTILIATLALGTLAFGAVEAWAWALMSILVAASLLLWAWAAVERRAARLVWTPLYIPAAIFLLIGLLQFEAGLTGDAVATREALLKLSTDAVIFALACQLWQDASPREMRRLGFATSLFACGLALFATLQFFASPRTIYGMIRPRWGGWIFGPYVNHNHYAGLMEMLIPVALCHVLSHLQSQRSPAVPAVPALTDRRYSRYGLNPLVRRLGPLATLIAIASVLLSGSRGGMIALAVEAVLLMAIIARFASEERRRLVIAGIAGVAASAALFLWLDPGRISQRLGAVADLHQAPEATLGERLELAHDALDIFRVHPWLGTGFGTFATVYPRYRSFASDLEWDHAHDDYAEALAETGVGGGVAILAAIGLFVALAFSGIRERLHQEGNWIRLGAAIGCCGLLVHSLGDFNLHIPANAAWFALLAGIAVSGDRVRPGVSSGTGATSAVMAKSVPQ
jgi:O-antigen ligase